MPATIVRPVPPATDVVTVRADLCRMARAQRAFFRAVGRYASSGELRSNGDFTSAGNDRWPYGYTVHTPVPDRFVVVASTVGTALNGHAPAITVDDTLHVCTLKPTLPDFRWRLDHPPEAWGEPKEAYDCEECP